MHSSIARGLGPERVDDLRRLLNERGAGAILVLAEDSRDPDLAPFAGPARLGRSVLVVTDASEPRLLCLSPMEREEAESTGVDLFDPAALDLLAIERRFADPNQFFAAAAVAALASVAPRPVPLAIAGRAPAGVTIALLQELGGGWKPSDGGEIMRAWRRKKTETELADCRRAAEVTGRVMRRLAGILAAAVEREGELWFEGERLKVGRLRQEVARGVAVEGMEQPERNIIAPGRDGGVPHSQGDDAAQLRAHTSLVVDLFPRSRLYADLTRTFCVGDPPEALSAAHARVLEALMKAERRAGPGVSGWDLQREVCDHFSASGYPTPISDPGTTRGYVHNLGHGVGYELHEVPSFRENTGDLGVLQAGDVITIEPGLYDPDAGYGVRIEDQLVVTESGCHRLVELPTSLDPAAWRAE